MNSSNESTTEEYDLIPISVKFWFYLIFLIPSISCSIVILSYILSNRTLRKALHYHAVIIFLLISLIYDVTIYPWMIYLYYHEGIWSRNELFCTVWIFIDWGLYYTQIILFAWATIERHILIFHSTWIITRRQRLVIHYCPLFFLITYCLLYYTLTIFFPPCQNHHDDYYYLCLKPCLFDRASLYSYDTIVHQISPNLIIIIFSILLLLRIRQQKIRIGKSLRWRKHWKMTVQLLFISILYLVFALPIAFFNFLHLCGVEESLIFNVMEYLLFFNYLAMLFCPFSCALSLPQLRNQVRKCVRFDTTRRTIAPTLRTIPQALENETAV